MHCGKPANKPANKVMGTPHSCLKRGVGIGIGIGEERGLKEGKKRGKKVGKVLGEVVGRKKGITIGKRKLTLGTGLTEAEVDRLSKDQLRSIILNLKRRNHLVLAGVSTMRKPALKTALLTNLRARNKLKRT